MKLKAVCIIIQNPEKEILLLLRDNKETIEFPNRWYILGGVVEENESPKKAIIREMQEEIELNLKNFKIFKIYEWPEKKEFVYTISLDLDPEKINLHEGQKIKFFSPQELLKTELAFHDNQIIRDFLKAH